MKYITDFYLLLVQLDDWVLCRIYNKKGKIEKYNSSTTVVDQKAPKFSSGEEVHYEHETKPQIHKFSNDHHQLYMDSSDSVPRLHTDSSCSEHVLSPDVTCEKEVESNPKWNNELDMQLFDAFDFQLNYGDNINDNSLSVDDPFGLQDQFQMNQLMSFQDMFMYQQKPF